MITKLFTLSVLSLLVAEGLALGQGGSNPTNVNQSIIFNAATLTPVASVNATQAGTRGNVTYFYAIVARYVGGNAKVSNPAQIVNANTTLSNVNFIVVTWNPVLNATGYDVLRTLTLPFTATGTCNCLVSSNQSGTLFNDQSNATPSSYTIASASNVTYVNQLDNQNFTIPTLEWSLNGNPSSIGSYLFNGNILATGTIIPRGFNEGIYYADQFPGSDPSIKINACNLAVVAAGGGTCDARGLGNTTSNPATSTPISLSQQITIGCASCVNTKINVVFIPPDTANWQSGLTDGTSCAIFQYGGSTIAGSGLAESRTGFHLSASNSANMDALYCTDPNPIAGASYISAKGMYFSNNSGTMVTALLHVQKLFDGSNFTNIIGVNNAGDVWNISNVCCGTVFNNIHGFSNITTGGKPLVFNGGSVASSATLIENSTFNDPVNGQPNILIQNQAYNLTCLNCYMEGNGGVDTSTAMVIVNNGTNSTSFIGGTAQGGCSVACNSKPIFENHTTNGFSVSNYQLGGNLTFGVNDIVNGATVKPGIAGVISNYMDSPTPPMFNLLTLAPALFSTLPACAAGTQGMKGIITDGNSTVFHAIATGGGGNSIPIYCDGSNWRVG